LPQPIDLGIQFVDPVEAFVEQDFESADCALLIFQFPPQAADGRAQLIIVAFELADGVRFQGIGR
jgi:hypothetical protein